jgi:chromosome segregation ATPase
MSDLVIILNKQIEELQKTLRGVADSKEGSRRYELWLKEQIATLEATAADDIRWMREMLQDYRIRYDDHSVGRRMALTTFIYGLKEQIAAMEAEVEQWKRIIVTHVDVIAEKEIEIDHLEQDNLTLQARVKELTEALEEIIHRTAYNSRLWKTCNIAKAALGGKEKI